MRVHGLTVGPIIGYTSDTSVRLWGRGQLHPKAGGFQRAFGVAQVLSGTGRITTQFFKLHPKFDFTGIADFGSLMPSTQYRYRVGYVLAELETADLESRIEELHWDNDAWRTVTTCPEPVAAKQALRFAFGSCRYLSRFGIFDERGDSTFKSIMQAHNKKTLDAFMMLGDQIYADDLAGIDPDSQEFEFFRKYQEAFSQPHLRELMASVPTYMMLDDHEICNNWNKGFEADAGLRELFLVAMKAYRPYQYVHGPGFKVPADNATDKKTLWYDFDCGPASFFALDTRTERRVDSNEMIGETQLLALCDWMNNKRHGVRFVLSSVPFFPDRPDVKDDDKWAGFAGQRQRILRFIVDNAVENVVFLSGDIHSSGCATATITNGKKITIHQIISSPFYWPGSPGTNRRFTNLSTLAEIDGSQFKVHSARYFTDDDNFVVVELVGKKLEVNCYGRKNKRLGSAVLELN